ncbi:hypothetical protein RYA05_28360 [Pseudomonas syringae pv. actinidiae]|uniref:Transcriptional regulator n=3 Tax=Pseudomonas syringae group TaxID=136849 RepID=A0A0K8LYX9_PSESF|nr:hypothetical protein [Pseudomonas syringae]EPN55330.1 hypothetical protein A235_37666 [Pseudomonas syringae pv. actinidiae ICMP 19079]EPN86595.1 hypothetical protein A234_00900 [Pseudomonas syringae pv. actinidiae ICMP 19101]OZI85431.1 hypothetical protein CFN58_18210 [Pseudomonas avellanae]AKT28774.1 hypothetical protein IYO_004495 [Pseudomonas syringae pv. actinidiae ICMP 18884]AOE55298.1 hypothetical protein NZ708_04490 [Pseudomonas syringae pv. actinidiae ICMP 18708]
MSDKELYEIEYTLLGEHHVDVIENLNVPIIEVVHELALKHHVELDDLSAGDAGMPHAAGITDVSIHSLEGSEGSATA